LAADFAGSQESAKEVDAQVAFVRIRQHDPIRAAGHHLVPSPCFWPVEAERSEDLNEPSG
jgi:hypothetical protein